MNATVSAERRNAPLDTPTGLRPEATRDISGALNALLADFFGPPRRSTRTLIALPC
jgi:hypothetical protein